MDGKICQNIKPPTTIHIPSSVQLSTWGRLEDWATNSFYTSCYMLKSFLWAKQNLTVFTKCQTSKNIKTMKIKFEVDFSYKDCIYNRFLLLKNFTSAVSFDLFT